MFELIDVDGIEEDFLKRHYEALEYIENYLLMAILRGYKASATVHSNSNWSGKYYDFIIFISNKENDKAKSFTLKIYKDQKVTTKAMLYLTIPRTANYNARKMAPALRRAGITVWNKEKSRMSSHCYQFYFYESSSQIKDLFALFGQYLP